jgi:hypothetical protein
MHSKMGDRRAAAERGVYRITLETTWSSAPPIIQLRRALKVLLRSFGLRCLEVAEVPAEASGDDVEEPEPPDRAGTKG